MSILSLHHGLLSAIKKGGPTPIVLPPYTIRFKTNRAVTQSDFGMGTLAVVDSDNNIYDLTYNNSNWNSLFLSASFLTEVIDANTTGVTRMNDTFGNCTSLTSVSLFDTSNVTDMGNMFNYCLSLTSVPLFDTSNVTNMQNMLSATSLTSVPLFDTSNVTDMSYMFQGSSSLTSVPLFDTSNVTDMSYMFFGCTSLISVPLFDTFKVTNMSYMFYYCTSVESGALALYQQASSQGTVTSHDGTFRDCGYKTDTGIAELAQIPDDWK